MRLVCIMIVLVVFSTGCQAEDLAIVSTPWGQPERWEDTWQQETVLMLSRLSGFSKYFGKSVLEIYGDKIKGFQRNRERALEENIAERMKERMPVDHLVIYEDYLHKLSFYKELENEVKTPDDLTTLIEHLKRQEKSLEENGKKMNEVFIEYIKDLEHVRDYWKKNEEQLRQVSTMNICLGTLLLILEIMSLVLLL